MPLRYDTPLDREKAIIRLRWLARFLDNAIGVPGTDFRFGYDGIIGLVPVVGDFITAGLSAYIVYEAHRLGAKGTTVAKMVVNVVVDFIISEVVVVGDIADLFFKANARNLRLLAQDIGIEGLSVGGVPTSMAAVEVTTNGTNSETARKHVRNVAAPV